MRSRAAAAPTVFRPYNAPGGLRDEMAATAARHPSLAKVVTIGKTLRGVPIQAVKVTKGARKLPDGRRPSVLYAGAQHAREWITPEMNRRLMHYVIDGYGTDPAITRLLDTTELWFLPVANPDGYDYTFTEGNRQWRKNLRDNNGDGQITVGDGVDLNRNFAEKWGYDNEGSSDDPASDTYRGTGQNSEPETKALDKLFRRIGFGFFVNYHSPPSCCCTASAGRSARPARTTRSPSRWPVTTRTRRCPATTRTSRPSSTPPTATPTTTPRSGTGRSASPPR